MQHEQLAEVLLVDRDPQVGESIISSLSRRSYEVEWVDDDEKAFNCLDARSFDVLVTELNIDRVNGMRLMGVARDRNPDICVVIIAEDPDIELATEAMRQGAYDFQTKPLNIGKLEAVIERGLGYQRLLYERHQLRRRLDETFGLTSLLGHSRAIASAYDKVRQAAPTEIPIILVGEAGTGKDFLALIIHHNSARSNGHFVKLRSAVGTSQHMERELLGHAEGALPGTLQARPGRMELADQGTLYLDSAGEFSQALLEQILRTLSTGKIQRFGDNRTLNANFRLIVSVTPESEEADRTHELSRTLQHSFNALTVELPPLRERREDIPILLEHFIQEFAADLCKNLSGISRNVVDLLTRYDWPGNVRELKGAVQAMVVGAKEGQVLDVLDVPAAIRHEAAITPGEIRIPAGASMQEIERFAIEETLRACGYKKEQAARTLGIGLRTLYRKLKAYESN